jgi:hypothetical protein
MIPAQQTLRPHSGTVTAQTKACIVLWPFSLAQQQQMRFVNMPRVVASKVPETDSGVRQLRQQHHQACPHSAGSASCSLHAPECTLHK